MEFDVRREMITSLDNEELRALYEDDLKQGKFWFRLYVNGCANADELYLHLVDIGLLDFQARRICVEFGEYADDRGITIAELFGVKEREVMSFMLIAASEEELEEKAAFFVQGVKQMKETVGFTLVQQIPDWAAGGANVTV